MSTLHVLVHGATGTQGSAITRRLLADGHSVSAATRSGAAPDGVRAVAVDLADGSALATAYRGVDAVVAQLPLEFGPVAVDHARNVLDALAGADVPRVVFNVGGPLPPEPVGVPYLDARSALAAGLGDVVPTATVLGPAGPYMENLAMRGSIERLARGVLAHPLPPGLPVPWVAIDDLATRIGLALGDPQPPTRRVVVGPTALTGEDVAATLSGLLGRRIRWTPVSADTYREIIQDDIGPAAAAGIAALYAADDPPPPLDPDQVVVGDTTFEAWARSVAWS